MEIKYSDITIINNGITYKLNKIMLMRIPYFKTLFNCFKESKEDIIYTDFNDKYWNRLLKDIYEYKVIELYNNFDYEFIRFLNFLGIEYDIEMFHKTLKHEIDLDRGVYKDLPRNFENYNFSLETFDYIHKVPQLRNGLQKECCNGYHEDSNLKNFKITHSYMFSDSEYHKDVFDNFFRDEILMLCNSNEHFDLYRLLFIYNKYIDEEIAINITKNYKSLLYKKGCYQYDYDTCHVCDLWKLIFNNYTSMCNIDMCVELLRHMSSRIKCIYTFHIIIMNYDKFDKYISEDNKKWFINDSHKKFYDHNKMDIKKLGELISL